MNSYFLIAWFELKSSLLALDMETKRFSSFPLMVVLDCFVISSWSSLPVNAVGCSPYSIKPRARWLPSEKAQLMKMLQMPWKQLLQKHFCFLFFFSQSWMFVVAQRLRGKMSWQSVFSDDDTHLRSISGRVLSPSTPSASNWLCLHKKRVPQRLKHQTPRLCRVSSWKRWDELECINSTLSDLFHTLM